jgi:hypothetical protein
VILFQVATPLKKSIKYTARSNPCWLLEILGEEALTGIQEKEGEGFVVFLNHCGGNLTTIIITIKDF